MTSPESAKSLVLVVGAGASAEVNLPIGSELKDRIASSLNFHFNNNGWVSGDYDIYQALKIVAAKEDGRQGDINPFLHACRMIQGAMPQATSIDNFIDAHRDNPLIEKCGKLAIARRILEAESNSTLRKNINFKAVESTWFNTFFRLLVDGCQRTELIERFSQVAVITFNYDRCIEHFFHSSLQNYYGLSYQNATEIMSKLSIYHPYGSIGPLPWQLDTPTGVEFGATPNPHQLLAIADQIKTFTEGTDETHSDIVAIRKTLASAKRISFLGFAYNPQNLKLLYGEEVSSPSKYCSIFGTAVGISKSNVEIITSELANFGKYQRSQIRLERELKCADLINEYWRSLSIH